MQLHGKINPNLFAGKQLIFIFSSFQSQKLLETPKFPRYVQSCLFIVDTKFDL